MNKALYIAATGLHAQQLQVDTIANNIANMSTAAYKASRVAFQDMMQAAPAAGAAAQARGVGVSGSVAVLDFGGGELKPSESPQDLAIRGAGFFEVQLADGSRAYTRGGRLEVNPETSLLGLAGGVELGRGIQVPAQLEELRIAPDGTVLARSAGEAAPHEIGRLELVSFANAAGLQANGDGLYTATELSGAAMPGRPGMDGVGTLAQGFVELSNVRLVDEMQNLMLAQRAYQLNSKLMETSDELMAMTNNLRRG